MSESHADPSDSGSDPSSEEDAESTRSEGPSLGYLVAFLFGVAALGSWVLTFVQARSLDQDLDAIVGASAIQISQVADQSQLELMQYWAVSFGLTTGFVVFAGLSALTRMSRG